MYGKFINGQFVRSPYRITEADAIMQGFKPVILTPAPQTDGKHYPVEHLEETETEIIRHWELVELPEPEPIDKEACPEDYEHALQEMGVDFSD